ncbi:protein RAFTIN 1B [Brachypodium distachyon]|uniref:BURP domain-containing protein n=1 Tax=Brachypodium distachyon TaxID=15368 RepID=I1I8A8_BRADI|nr:protein RAFTIN 1B [Brachypodium distachyon]KQJ98849.1 hypothetical protein BRADI_3g39490v3 [Brachypodium distachyon]|eukprot:XP_010235278.1 protein RAFTIN 1B [Brachypodium distachyon]
MARFLVLAFLAASLVAAGWPLGQAAPAKSTAEVFWRAALPDSPLPDAILRLLRPAPAAESGFVSRGAEDEEATNKPPFNYQDYKRPSGNGAASLAGDSPFGYKYQALSSSGKRAAAVGAARDFDYDDYSASEEEKRAGTGKQMAPSGYDYKKAAGERRRRAAAPPPSPFMYAYKTTSATAGNGKPKPPKPAPSPFMYAYVKKKASTATGANGKTTTVFFHEEAVRVGERLRFHFPPASPAPLGLLPRHVADSIPFSPGSLPAALATLGVAPDSAMARRMEATLSTCDDEASPAITGESKFCAASLEALVEGAMASLGTRDIRPLTSRVPRAGAPAQTYAVRAVRAVEGGPVFVACHDEPYPYAVYRCHTTGPARAYVVDMDGEDGGDKVTLAAVCHTDTSLWNPDHVSFQLLATKPGGAPVCHLMPYGHVLWGKDVKRSPA